MYQNRSSLKNNTLIYLNCFQDRNSFTLKLEDTENWLYEEGEDQPKQVYIDKLVELKVSETENCQIFFSYKGFLFIEQQKERNEIKFIYIILIARSCNVSFFHENIICDVLPLEFFNK